MPIEEACAMTTRVSPSFIRVGHFDLFGRFQLHLLFKDDVGSGGGNDIDPFCAMCAPALFAFPSCLASLRLSTFCYINVSQARASSSDDRGQSQRCGGAPSFVNHQSTIYSTNALISPRAWLSTLYFANTSRVMTPSRLCSK